MKPVWQARTGSGLSPAMQALGDSTAEDKAFLGFDIQGSIAHVLGLKKAGLLTPDEAERLAAALRGVPDDLSLDPSLEDVHMNLEAYLGSKVGALAKKVHTARSRNDQVATCIALYARHHLVALVKAELKLLSRLQAAVSAHGETPWVAKTHGKAAQAATIGFLLHAHAGRFVKHAEQTLLALRQVESPLGAGAIAGSTLAIDPVYTAKLLGLPPATNALSATGTRDVALQATQAAAGAGMLVADLASDLLGAEGLQLASQHTSGSSLMPHKRNPDGLELLRGKGHALASAPLQIQHITAGLGLGYQRDMQACKPPLAAVPQAVQLVSFMAEVVEKATFAPVGLDDPGLLATDLAEALVADGMAFRDAYALVARVYAEAEQGVPFEQAVQALPLAVLPLRADPAARVSHGAPGNLPSLQNAIKGVREAVAPFVTAIGQAEALPEVLW